MRQRIEAVVDHPQGFAQVVLAVGASCQVGEIGGEAGCLRGPVVLVERNALDAELERGVRGDRPTIETLRSTSGDWTCCLRHDLPDKLGAWGSADT